MGSTAAGYELQRLQTRSRRNYFTFTGGSIAITDDLFSCLFSKKLRSQ
jgi:hypothetical protein